MKSLRPLSVLCLVCVVSPALGQRKEMIYLASSPALSPDGKTVVFSWKGDIWSAPSRGGEARQLTRHPARDLEPRFSPDGKQIAFTSDRHGSQQVYAMPAEGGVPERLTFHTAGYALHEWYPDGEALLVSGSRDHFWRDSRRFFRVSRSERAPERLLFDAHVRAGSLSPDGKRLLFTREGGSWWRKGYRGSRASQIWLYDLQAKEFTKLLDHESGCRSPLWKPNGKGFYYVGAQSGSFNLWEHDLKSGKQRQLTHFEDDSVVDPCLSRDGSTIVFRHLFDFYRFRPRRDKSPKRIELWTDADSERPRTENRALKEATEVAFSDDGLEMAFIAGGDLWVMDTVLREPRQITSTAEQESNAVLSPDGNTLLFVSDSGGQSDIWRARRHAPNKYWWQNETFQLDRITTDTETESRLTFSPDGSKIAFVKGNGDLWIADADGRNAKRLLESFNAPDYDWSPDGKWLVYAVSDSNFNRDIWVMPVDGSAKPYNLSRHPDNEYGPVWSPDGKIVAFTGRRRDTEIDIYYIWLTKGDHEMSKRDRSIREALEKMDKVRKKKETPSVGKDDAETTKTAKDETQAETEPTTPGLTAREVGEKKNEKEKKKEEQKELPKVVIDFDGIHERVKHVSIPDASERGLLWSHDSKKLAFTATIKGESGTYTLEFPDQLEPKLLSEKTGTWPRWIKEGNQIVWLSGGTPGSLSAAGKATSYSFETKQEIDLEARNRAGFILAWRYMRDSYYDGRLNNRDWDAVRRKYEDSAVRAPDGEVFASVVNLMLGELNGSHLGFSPSLDSWKSNDQWREETAHLGLRFAPDYPGPGLKVRDLLPEGPSDREKSHIEAGEVVLSIDGTTVTASMDLTAVLNGPLDRDIDLLVRDSEETTRNVTVRPISYLEARRLLRKKWIEDNRRAVDELSSNTLGYLHIPGMNWPSFQEFEREIYAQGAGKEGLIIDVRNNGGGFTTDHLLTVLCQPSHAITVPRGGSPGYPQDRRVYATWDKPIVVLCNQNSFSNAEIFSHAIKTLKRGQLVGVRTAGGVISTGRRRILDLGTLRMPYRGWFTIGEGEDMELNGAVPHHILWPQPGEIPAGKDVQLQKAIEVLLEEVKATPKPPRPRFRHDTGARQPS